jgi:hypothetical protein
MKSASGGSRLNFWEFVEQLQQTEGRGLAKENEDCGGKETDAVFQVGPVKQTDRTQSRLGEGTSDPEGLHSALDRVRRKRKRVITDFGRWTIQILRCNCEPTAPTYWRKQHAKFHPLR